MQITPTLRLLATLALIILILAGLLFLALLTESLLNIRTQLEQAPAWVWLPVGAAFLLFAALTSWLIWVLLPGKRQTKQAEQPPPPTESNVQQQIETAKASGLDTREAEAELELRKRRRESGLAHIALFGDISSGKSSLIRALLPDASVATSVVGGTTQEIHHYQWQSPAGDRLILTDMPGMDEAGGLMAQESLQEAQRAHIVIYLLEGDLTRSQEKQLQSLLALNKPLILVLNKTDRMTVVELNLVTNQLRKRLQVLGSADIPVVPISAGGRELVVQIDQNGEEQEIARWLPPKLDALLDALSKLLDGQQQALDKLADNAVFSLVASHLDQALSRHRANQAAEISRSFAKKAVMASLASVTPGTDIVIQGYLGTQMVKELCQLYQVPIRQIDLDVLLQLVQRHAKPHITVILALAGNVFKAFPGVGTLAGGALHGVAYGLLFEALGKGVSASLANSGMLQPQQVAKNFEDNLSVDLRQTAGSYARLVVSALAEKAQPGQKS